MRFEKLVFGRPDSNRDNTLFAILRLPRKKGPIRGAIPPKEFLEPLDNL